MITYESIVEATVIDENERYYFAQYQGVTCRIAKSLLEDDEHYQVGDVVEGLIYEMQDGHVALQLDLPIIRPGYYDWGTVVMSRKDLGVFVDVGLHDKEVVVSLDDLPEDRQLWPKKGDRLYVTFEADKHNRLWGKISDTIPTKKAHDKLKNQNIVATVIRPPKSVGASCITEEGYPAFLHESEWVQTPRLGEVLNARVIGINPHGELNISVRPRAHEVLDDDAEMIVALLEKSPNHFMPLHDKSDPDEIQKTLGISKAQFKRAVGTLMKQGRIKQVKHEGIWLQ